MKRLWILTLLSILACATASGQESPLERADRSGANPSTPVRKPGQRSAEQQREKPFSDPRRWVFMAVVAFLVIGGGRKWLFGRRGQKMADRLACNEASIDEIRRCDQWGRIVVPELFRILTEGATAEYRLAALEALVKLWRADELIPEEEKAILTRSFSVDWQIRRKYPRRLTGAIEFRAFFGPPELTDDKLRLWLVEHLRWSYRVAGTRRASDDAWQPARIGLRQCRFQVVAEDFPEDGPHRLMLHLRVRTEQLTDNWELDLPAQSTSFEWDDHLQPNALVTLPDSERAEAWSKAISFIGPTGVDLSPFFIQLDSQFALRNPPQPSLKLPLPCDLAHQVFLEFENIPCRWRVGEWVEYAYPHVPECFDPKRWPDQAIAETPGFLLPHAGRFRMRIVLTPTPERGWSDPMIRSVWPEPITTEWVDVEVVRT